MFNKLQKLKSKTDYRGIHSKLWRIYAAMCSISTSWPSVLIYFNCKVLE